MRLVVRRLSLHSFANVTRQFAEEILYETEAIWWSDDGRDLAFLRIDDKDIKQIRFPIYDAEQPYPHITSIPYPKVKHAGRYEVLTSLHRSTSRCLK